jgi:hypothetical protein
VQISRIRFFQGWVCSDVGVDDPCWGHPEVVVAFNQMSIRRVTMTSLTRWRTIRRR